MFMAAYIIVTKRERQRERERERERGRERNQGDACMGSISAKPFSSERSNKVISTLQSLSRSNHGKVTR